MSAVVEVEDLTKRYGSVRALNGISLTVNGGAVFGLLGPNGAGKTTLLRILLGFILPSGGQVSLWGDRHVGRVRRRIGYLPELPQYHLLFSAEEYLSFSGHFSGLGGRHLRQRVDFVLELVRLDEFRKRRLREYSKGMLQRVGIAQALLPDPELLILDEPAGGLDPVGQKDVRDVLDFLKAENKTVLLSSHNLTEVERACTQVAIVDRGVVVRDGSLDDLLPDSGSVQLEVGPINPEQRAAIARFGFARLTSDDCIVLENASPEDEGNVLRYLLDNKIRILSLTRQRISLEWAYLEATKGRVV